MLNYTFKGVRFELRKHLCYVFWFTAPPPQVNWFVCVSTFCLVHHLNGLRDLHTKCCPIVLFCMLRGWPLTWHHLSWKPFSLLHCWLTLKNLLQAKPLWTIYDREQATPKLKGSVLPNKSGSKTQFFMNSLVEAELIVLCEMRYKSPNKWTASVSFCLQVFLKVLLL